jgi:hypothetical protein
VTPPGTSPVGPAVLECKLLSLTGNLTADAEVVARTTATTSSAMPSLAALPLRLARFVRNPTAPIGRTPMSTTDHEEIENVLLQAAQSVILIAVPVVVLDSKNQR